MTQRYEKVIVEERHCYDKDTRKLYVYIEDQVWFTNN